jgi:hypothetical protein
MATGDAAIKVDQATVQIFATPAMSNPGLYPTPMPFGGMGRPINENGFFDHFPITVTVTEAD